MASHLVLPDRAFRYSLHAQVVPQVRRVLRGHPGLGGERRGVPSLQGSPLSGCTGLRWGWTNHPSTQPGRRGLIMAPTPPGLCKSAAHPVSKHPVGTFPCWCGLCWRRSPCPPQPGIPRWHVPMAIRLSLPPASRPRGVLVLACIPRQSIKTGPRLQTRARGELGSKVPWLDSAFHSIIFFFCSRLCKHSSAGDGV